MQKIKFARFAMVLAVILGMASCEYDTIEIEKVVIPPDQTISFSTDIIPIFTNNCSSTSCHGGGISPDLRAANAYNSLVNGGYINTDNPSGSGIYTILLEDSHSSRASANEKQLILEWITRGAKND